MIFHSKKIVLMLNSILYAYLSRLFLFWFVNILKNGNVLLRNDFNQVRRRIYFNISLSHNFPQSICEIFHTEYDRKCSVVNDSSVVSFIVLIEVNERKKCYDQRIYISHTHSSQIIFRDVTNFLRCTRTFNWRCRKGKDNVSFLKFLQSFKMSFHVFGGIN